MCTKCRTNNESYNGLLKKYKILGITDGEEGRGGWYVNSVSGNRYYVNRQMRMDKYTGSLFFTWNCDCPARKRCRHIDAVEDIEYAETMSHEDYDGVEMLERTI